MRKCIFCGYDENFSKEHIIAQWIQKELNIARENLITISGTEDVLNTSRILAFDKLVEGRVCEKCNNGWMSQLENDNKSHIFNLMHLNELGTEFNYLSNSGGEKFARWSFKTAILLDRATNNSPIVQNQHFHNLYSGIIPKDVVIDISITEDNTPSQWRGSDFFLSNQALFDDNKVRYTIAFQLMHLLISLRCGIENNQDNDTFEIFPKCGLKGKLRLYENIDSMMLHCL